MKIEHIAMYANDSEVIKDFFVQYFNAACNEGYHNKTTDFRSYFLKFDDCARLEIMKKPEMEDGVKDLARTGYIHIIEAAEKLDAVIARFVAQGLSPEETSDRMGISLDFVVSSLNGSK